MKFGPIIHGIQKIFRKLFVRTAISKNWHQVSSRGYCQKNFSALSFSSAHFLLRKGEKEEKLVFCVFETRSEKKID
jgi:hypothetical protein